MLELFSTVKIRPNSRHYQGGTRQLGTIIDIYSDPRAAYEVEFCDENGRTLETLVLLEIEIEPAAPPP